MNATSPESGQERPSDWPTVWVAQTQLLLDSFAHWRRHELIPRCGTPLEQAMTLFHAPFVVVSHDTQPDPVLNYGNQRALDLWEFDIETLCRTPSRLTAETMHRQERARLLQRTEQNGFVDDYRGIRISRTGKRFLIERAVVWNLVDSQGVYQGQAATFSRWQACDS